MTNEQILKKAIEKADKTGYIILTTPYEEIKDYLIDKRYYGIIFSHEFAKAFWGDGEISYKDRELTNYSFDNVITYQKRWEWHLQKMVLEEQPLKYIEKFLNKNK